MKRFFEELFKPQIEVGHQAEKHVDLEIQNIDYDNAHPRRCELIKNKNSFWGIAVTS